MVDVLTSSQIQCDWLAERKVQIFVTFMADERDCQWVFFSYDFKAFDNWRLHGNEIRREPNHKFFRHKFAKFHPRRRKKKNLQDQGKGDGVRKQSRIQSPRFSCAVELSLGLTKGIVATGDGIGQQEISLARLLKPTISEVSQARFLYFEVVVDNLS